MSPGEPQASAWGPAVTSQDREGPPALGYEAGAHETSAVERGPFRLWVGIQAQTCPRPPCGVEQGRTGALAQSGPQASPFPSAMAAVTHQAGWALTGCLGLGPVMPRAWWEPRLLVDAPRRFAGSRRRRGWPPAAEGLWGRLGAGVRPPLPAGGCRLTGHAPQKPRPPPPPAAPGPLSTHHPVARAALVPACHQASCGSPQQALRGRLVWTVPAGGWSLSREACPRRPRVRMPGHRGFCSEGFPHLGRASVPWDSEVSPSEPRGPELGAAEARLAFLVWEGGFLEASVHPVCLSPPRLCGCWEK